MLDMTASQNDAEAGMPPLDPKKLLEQLKRPPLFVLWLPRPLALVLGVSSSGGLAVRSPWVLMLMLEAVYFTFDDDSMLDAVAILVAAVLLAWEGGYKAFAQNLQVLAQQNLRYSSLLEQHRQANMALQNTVGDLRETDKKLEAENTILQHSNAELQGTAKQLRASVGQLQMDATELQQQNVLLQQTEAKLRTAVAQQDSANQELQRQNLLLQETEASLRSSVASQEAATRELQQQADELAVRNETLKKAEAELQATVAKHEDVLKKGVSMVKKLNESKRQLGGEVQTLTQQNEDLCQTTAKLRNVLKIAGEHVGNAEELEKKLFQAVDDLSEVSRRMKRNNLEQRKRQLRDIFLKFDVDLERPGEIHNEEQVKRMKNYVQAVYSAKMEKLRLDLDGDGVVSWEEFEAVLMKDSFWNDEHDEVEA